MSEFTALDERGLQPLWVEALRMILDVFALPETLLSMGEDENLDDEEEKMAA